MINTKNITKTKVVATLGPASDSPEVLREMIEAGLDLARLNFSHGTLEEKKNLFYLLRELSREYQDQLSVMCDIQGPKIRTGLMECGFQVHPGDVLKVTPNTIVGSKEKGIQISYDEMLTDLNAGDFIYINDGIVKLVVQGKDDEFLTCLVENGGQISDRKGCNIPSGNLSVNIITPKDEEDLQLIAELSPDFIAASFIGTADDVQKVRNKLKEYGNTSVRIIAKIERPSALENIDAIIEAADGIMVARGDLGVEIDTWLVPVAQKEICAKCNRVGKPVIVATQMLESMTNSSRPTRAEANDVFNAVLDGADAVMLSGETSVGVDPGHVVRTMDKIIKTAEENLTLRHGEVSSLKSEDMTAQSILKMSLEIQKQGKKGIILVYSTKSSYFTRMISKYRPPMDIISFTHKEKVVHKLNVQWGVRAVLCNEEIVVTDIPSKATLVARKINALDILTDEDFIIFASRTIADTPTLALFTRDQFESQFLAK